MQELTLRLSKKEAAFLLNIVNNSLKEVNTAFQNKELYKEDQPLYIHLYHKKMMCELLQGSLEQILE